MQLCEHGCSVHVGPVQDQAIGDIARKVEYKQDFMDTTWQHTHADRVRELKFEVMSGTAKRSVKEVLLIFGQKSL